MNGKDETQRMADVAALDEDIVGALAQAIVPEAPPLHLKNRILDRVRGAAVHAVTLRDKQAWKELAPGIEYKFLFVDEHARSKSFLLKAAPGVRMPGHFHSGPEECLVIEGEFSMGDITLRAGDFHCVGAGTYHDVASTETGVVVYIRSDQADYPMIQP